LQHHGRCYEKHIKNNYLEAGFLLVIESCYDAATFCGVAVRVENGLNYGIEIG